ncbi:GDP-fucose synthetase [Candidatus Marinamargulisbacteria bacterium SCGC AAA071-K20]|nr:GDP-fucose synthetase [Candidatus Marinamargulisbacteria bacterium SCGC AAA071-K20]
MWKQKRVLVTGAGGFLGSHLLEQLKPLNPEELIVVRQKDFDLTEQADVRKLFKTYSPHLVFHLAGHVSGLGANNDYPADFFYRNMMMISMLAEEAHKAGVKKIVATGAGCGYPEQAPLPLKESDFWNGYPQYESAPYSLAKRMLHIQSDAYWRQYKLPIIVGLPGNIYGPYDNFDLEAAHVGPALVRKFVEAMDTGTDSISVWGSGKPTRDFVYAGDVAKGLIKAAEKCEEPLLVNLSSGKETSIVDLVNLLKDISGYKGEITWDSSKVEGQSRRVFDVSVARDKLGFTAETSVKEGFEKTYQWYKENKESARNNFEFYSKG